MSTDDLQRQLLVGHQRMDFIVYEPIALFDMVPKSGLSHQKPKPGRFAVPVVRQDASEPGLLAAL
ncbi:hypothetical protein [Nocardia acidivorans]|uniref:hypothetical protein n=1 Tax=Nocardia acidivorans TaxID=404580 RepID=UPI0012F7F49F|nr:hypothetical protein [Nocardia acidivorans]